MKYIPYSLLKHSLLKLIASALNLIYSLIMPKYSKHGQRKITIPPKTIIITIIQTFGFPYRDTPAIAEDITHIIGINNTTTFQNIHAIRQKK